MHRYITTFDNDIIIETFLFSSLIIKSIDSDRDNIANFRVRS